MTNCGNCKEGKKNGFTMTYCTFYGIFISSRYNRCARHKPRIIEVENEDRDKGNTKTA